MLLTGSRRTSSSLNVRRSSVVVAAGATSHAKPLRDIAFQGIVSGHPLWTMFSKASEWLFNAAVQNGAVCAEDMNAFKSYAQSSSNEITPDHLRTCQADDHDCGSANQVVFDPSREHFAVLHRLHGVHTVTFSARLLLWG